jgi:hypothetical protein
MLGGVDCALGGRWNLQHGRCKNPLFRNLRWQWIQKRQASNNQLTGTTMLTLSNVASIHRAIRQQEGAAAVDQTRPNVDAKLLIFWAQCTMDDVHRASAADTKLDRGRVGMGLRKG